MKKLAEILWESTLGADALLTARHRPALSRTSLTPDSVCLELLESRRILAKLQPRYVLRMLVSANEGGLEDPDVVTTVKNIALNAAGTHCFFLEIAYCSASPDSSCCTYLMLVTECVTSQKYECYPWLQKLVDTGSWTAIENLFTQWQNLFPVFQTTNLLVR